MKAHDRELYTFIVRIWKEPKDGTGTRFLWRCQIRPVCGQEPEAPAAQSDRTTRMAQAIMGAVQHQLDVDPA